MAMEQALRKNSVYTSTVNRQKNPSLLAKKHIHSTVSAVKRNTGPKQPLNTQKVNKISASPPTSEASKKLVEARNNTAKMSTGKRWLKGAMGALQVVGGALQVGAGVALSSTGLGAVLGVPTAVYGAANVAQGIGEIVNAFKGKDKEAPNFVNEGFKWAGRKLGGKKGEKIASGIFTATDIALGFVGGASGVIKGVKHLKYLKALRTMKNPIALEKHLNKVIKTVKNPEAAKMLLRMQNRLKKAKYVVKNSAGKLFEEHHIISDKNPITLAHNIFKKAKVGAKEFLNLSKNKVKLPTLLGKTFGLDGAVHYGKHTKKISLDLAEEMSKALLKGKKPRQYQKALERIMGSERKALTSGKRVLNKVGEYFNDFGKPTGIKAVLSTIAPALPGVSTLVQPLLRQFNDPVRAQQQKAKSVNSQGTEAKPTTEQRIWKGAMGALQAVGGGIQVAAGAALSSTGLGAILGVPVAAYGAANVGQGLEEMWYAIKGENKEGKNFMQEGFKALGRGVGSLFGKGADKKGEKVANALFTISDGALGLVGGGSLKYFKHISKLGSTAQKLKYINRTAKLALYKKPLKTVKSVLNTTRERIKNIPPIGSIPKMVRDLSIKGYIKYDNMVRKLTGVNMESISKLSKKAFDGFKNITPKLADKALKGITNIPSKLKNANYRKAAKTAFGKAETAAGNIAVIFAKAKLAQGAVEMWKAFSGEKDNKEDGVPHPVEAVLRPLLGEKGAKGVYDGLDKISGVLGFREPYDGLMKSGRKGKTIAGVTTVLGMLSAMYNTMFKADDTVGGKKKGTVHRNTNGEPKAKVPYRPVPKPFGGFPYGNEPNAPYVPIVPSVLPYYNRLYMDTYPGDVFKQAPMSHNEKPQNTQNSINGTSKPEDKDPNLQAYMDKFAESFVKKLSEYSVNMGVA